ncbi:unnamed protein product, partial [Eretmochelys imbricata]
MAPARDRLLFRFPGYGDGVLRRMDQLRAQRRFCDVTVQVNELRVPGHRVVFAACSPFLRDQFLLSDSPEVSVSLLQSPEIGRRLLLSCYTGCLEVPLPELVHYLAAASFLQMGHVVGALHAGRRPATWRPGPGGSGRAAGRRRRGAPPAPCPVRRRQDGGGAGRGFAGGAAAAPRPRRSPCPSSTRPCGAAAAPCRAAATSTWRRGGPAPRRGGRGGAATLRRRPLEPARKDRPAGLGAARKAPELERPYRCPRCQGLFPQLAGFASHVREHRLFLCLRCAKLFSQKSNLTRHLRVHSGFKPFQCPSAASASRRTPRCRTTSTCTAAASRTAATTAPCTSPTSPACGATSRSCTARAPCRTATRRARRWPGPAT